MMKILGKPEIKMHIQYQKDKNSPLVDLGECNVSEQLIEQIMSEKEE